MRFAQPPAWRGRRFRLPMRFNGTAGPHGYCYFPAAIKVKQSGIAARSILCWRWTDNEPLLRPSAGGSVKSVPFPGLPVPTAIG